LLIFPIPLIEQNIPPLVVTTISMGIGAGILLGVGLAYQGLPALSYKAWGIIAWLAIVNNMEEILYDLGQVKVHIRQFMNEPSQVLLHNIKTRMRLLSGEIKDLSRQVVAVI